MIEWFKNAKREDTVMSERRVWRSRCGHYRVEECNIKFGRTYDRHGGYNGYPVFYRAMTCVEGIWKILSEHKTRTGAVKQCEYFSEHGHKMPARTKTEKAIKRVKAKRRAKREAKNAEA